MPLNARITRAKEILKSLTFFFQVQLFCAILLLSFSFGGTVFFGIIAALPPIFFWALRKKNAYRMILYYLCVAFVIGQRTVYIGQYFRIVPSTVILWVLAITCAVVKPRGSVLKKPIPGILLLLFGSSAWGVFLAGIYDGNINLGFAYAHMLWISLPAFYVIRCLIHRLEQVKDIVNILVLGCIFLSFLAIAEYMGLGFVHYFSGYVKGVTAMGQGGFTRMTASFWGGPALANYLALCLPLALAQFFSSKTTTQKSLSALSAVLMFITIYLSGFRGVWLPVLIGIAVYFYLKGARGIFVLLILIAVGVHFIPEHAKSRMSGLVGAKRDSSSVKREHRFLDAWEMVKEHPILGSGWGSSGLVHSEFIQVWADAGFIAFFSYVGIFLLVLQKIFRIRKARSSLVKEHFRGFYCSVLVSMLILIPETWLNLPEMYSPLWIVMALAYQYPNIIQFEAQIAMNEKNKENSTVILNNPSVV